MPEGFFCNTVLKTVKMHILTRLRDKWPCSYYTASVYCSITESFKKKRQSHFVGDPLSHWKVALLTHKVRATATPAYLSDLIQTHVPIRSLRSSWLGHHAAYRIPKTIVIVWFITVIQKEKGDWGGGRFKTHSRNIQTNRYCCMQSTGSASVYQHNSFYAHKAGLYRSITGARPTSTA